MKQREVEHVRTLWHLIRMAAWLHLVTVVFTVSKWTGLLHLTWSVAFLPSLLYGALVLLIVGGCTTLALGRRISSPSRSSAPVMASSN